MGLGLEHLFSWVPQLIEWIMGFVPRFGRIPVHDMAVRVGGPKWKMLGPGVYFWVPHFHVIYRDNVTRKDIALPEEVLTTKDDSSVRVGGTMEYQITDIEVWLLQNDDPDNSIQVSASKVLRRWIKGMEFEQVQDSDEGELTRMAQKALGDKFGVEIAEMSMACFAVTESRSIHHSGITSLQAASEEEE